MICWWGPNLYGELSIDLELTDLQFVESHMWFKLIKKKTPNINQNREIALKMFAFMFVCVYLKQRSSFFLNKRCCCCFYVLYISLELFVKFICNLEFLNFVPRIEFWFFNVLFFYISLNLRCVLKKKLTKKDWNQNQIENFGFRPISVCFFWAAQQNFVNYFAF